MNVSGDLNVTGGIYGASIYSSGDVGFGGRLVMYAPDGSQLCTLVGYQNVDTSGNVTSGYSLQMTIQTGPDAPGLLITTAGGKAQSILELQTQGDASTDFLWNSNGMGVNLSRIGNDGKFISG